jgi:hypothetical protein
VATSLRKIQVGRQTNQIYEQEGNVAEKVQEVQGQRRRKGR